RAGLPGCHRSRLSRDRRGVPGRHHCRVISPMPPVAAERLVQTQQRRRLGKPGAASGRSVQREDHAGGRSGGRVWQDVEPVVSVERLRELWSAAFAAARVSLQSARLYVPPVELSQWAKRLAVEREHTLQLLQAYARDEHESTAYARLPIAVLEARRMLRLPPGVDACVFNVDGVLLGSARLHAEAWSRTFNEFIARRVERTGGLFAPFSPLTDYPMHVHGRPRRDGVRNFLASRGIRLPEGSATDPAGTETVFGLANRKNELLLRLLDEHGLNAFEGSHQYLELVRDAGIGCAVVSASANLETMLERAGLAALVEARVDGNMIVAEQLQPRPAPDILLAACRQLAVEPADAAVFETTPAGVLAARNGGFAWVVGVDP